MYKRYVERLNAAIKLSFKELLNIADAEKCRVINVPGSNGLTFALVEDKYIQLGTDQSNLRRTVVLAHEIGHVLDFKKTPLTQEERDIVNGPLNLMKDNPDALSMTEELLHQGVENWKKSQIYYNREKAAWEFAEDILNGTGLLKIEMADKNFQDLKRTALRSYYKIMKKSKSVAISRVG